MIVMVCCVNVTMLGPQETPRCRAGVDNGRYAEGTLLPRCTCNTPFSIFIDSFTIDVGRHLGLPSIVLVLCMICACTVLLQ